MTKQEITINQEGNDFSKLLSLTACFWFFAFSLLIVATSFYLYFTWGLYRTKVLSALQWQTVRVESVLDNEIDYTVYLLNYFSSQISENGSSNLNYVNNLLTSFKTKHEMDERISWNMFSWVDDHENLVINSAKGFVKPISVTDRDYILFTTSIPNQLYLGQMVQGKVSKRNIIPATMGVTDKNKKYLGTLVFGIQLDKLTNKLQEGGGLSGVEFAIFDENANIILNSADFKFDQNMVKQLQAAHGNKLVSGILSDFSLINDSTFSFYRKAKLYPYFIVASYDKKLFFQDIATQSIPYVIQMFFLLLMVAFIIWIIKFAIVKPISMLSTATEAISKDKEDFTLPNTAIKEINNLIEQIINVRNYKNELKRAKNYQVKFFANMNHELRTPLNGIISLSYLAMNEIGGPLNEIYKGYMGDIWTSGNHLLKLIDNILEFSNMETGEVVLQEVELSIREEMEEVIKDLIEKAKQNEIGVGLKIKPDLPKLLADKTMFKRIIRDLFSNAVKYSKKNGYVSLSASINGQGDLEILIEDTGVGIKPEDLEALLSGFGQAGGGYTRSEKQGNGLGLSIVRKMLELHKGRLSINSLPNKGTTVMVIFPKERLR